MAAPALELVALALTVLGLIGAAASTGMPMWKVTAFIQENIIVMETRWEGLWMNCFRQANIRMQCKVYDSLLYLPPELQASRGLMCTSVALAAIGLLVGIAGMRCTACIQGNDRAKRLVLVASGSVIMVSGLCCIIPVSWTAHVIIQDFYNPLLLDAQRRELGEALYIGWVSAVLLLLGGAVFACCSGTGARPPERPRYVYKENVPYVAYQPQPLMFQPRADHASRAPSFLQTSSAPSIIHTSREHSFTRTPRQQSVRSGVAYL